MAEDINQSEKAQQEQLSLARLTADIVAAFVANNGIVPTDIASLIEAVAKGLAGLSQERASPRLRAEPIIPVRRSVAPDHLVCLLCGKRQKLLKRHLAIEHNLTPEQYREAFGLRPDYPMVAPNYAEQRAELARKIGLGKPLRRRAAASARRSRLGSDPTTKP